MVDLTIELSSHFWLPDLETTKRLKIIDEMMHKLGFYRREKWQKNNWGWKAKIRKK